MTEIAIFGHFTKQNGRLGVNFKVLKTAKTCHITSALLYAKSELKKNFIREMTNSESGTNNHFGTSSKDHSKEPCQELVDYEGEFLSVENRKTSQISFSIALMFS